MNGATRTGAALVLLVEDEPAIAEAVAFALQAEGWRTRHCASGAECLAALAGEAPALVLLDVGLPDMGGFELFGRLRERWQAPVVFLTARREEIDRVVGLEMGADDYVTKPFSLRELVARVRTVLRRSAPPAASAAAGSAPPVPVAPEPLAVGPFVHDEARRCVAFRGRELPLTLHEYRLLVALLAHPGRVFERGQLLELAWEAPDHRLDRTVDSHVKSLRAKLRGVDATLDPIRTHRGLGYSLEPGA